MRSVIRPGDKFTDNEVIGRDPDSKKSQWLCRCVCGKVTSQRASSLTSGAVKSCGCRRTRLFVERNTKHGKYTTPEYRAWDNMRTRCHSKKTPYFKHYGERGIAVCSRWMESFDNFLEDMGTRPSPSHSLDRINNDGDYSPENCRWATQKEQLRNRRGNVNVTIDGVTKTLAEWSEISGIGYKTISCRLAVGRSAKDAVFSKPFARMSP